VKTAITEQHLASDLGRQANDILRSCVHCGFCNATCPTYQLTGDELDGPRGRIYQIKEMLEGQPASATTLLHLDRCLTCRNCETTCPSGVNYTRLLDTGRQLAVQQVGRSLPQRVFRGLLRRFLLSPLFGVALATGRAVRPILPGPMRNAVPGRNPIPAAATSAGHARRVLLVAGCVQRSLQPSIDAAAAIVFDRYGIGAVPSAQAGCCGALNHHLDAEQAALRQARRNIDAWLPLLEGGAVDAITMTASGCGVMIRDYRHLLQHDPDYRDKAERISAAFLDPVEVVEQYAERRPQHRGTGRIAYHPPCSQQHGLKINGAVERVLSGFGYELLPFDDSHLCCGSAGTYAITQKRFAQDLRRDKLEHIEASRPELIATANIGCQKHLQEATEIPVRHWLELLAHGMKK
jgi:glycolate oxidase iron-sulfur subunit